MSNKFRIAIATLGCKTNQFDSAVIVDRLLRKDHQLVHFNERADIYIINTCTVTGSSDYQSRQLMRRFKKNNPDSKIIVTGCYAQFDPLEICKIEGVDAVIGINEEDKIPDIIESNISTNALVSVSNINMRKSLDFSPLRNFHGHTRAFLKIQEGCNMFCSYCIVPYVRGRSISLEPSKVIEGIRYYTESDFKEVVLTGTHIGRYGIDLTPSIALTSLLKEIEASNLTKRLRLSSIDPDEIDLELIKTISSSNIICNHLHIPIQSGDDGILRSMKRNYSKRFIEKLIYSIVEKIKDVSIGLDVMIGYPGEDEDAFKNTYNLIKSLPVAYLHVFPFSRRKNTFAETLPNQINGKIIKERSLIMRDLGYEKRREFYKRFIGKRLDVLVENEAPRAKAHGFRHPLHAERNLDHASVFSRRDKIEYKSGLLKGYSRNYIKVQLQQNNDIMGKIVEAKIRELRNGCLLGEI